MGTPGRFRLGRLGLAAVAACAALPAAGPTAPRAILLGLALGIVPGALLAPRLLPSGSRARRALLALALSPFLAAGPAAVLVAAGCPVGVAARVVLLSIAGLALFDARRPGPAPPPVPERAAFGAAASWTALVGALLIGNRHLATRSDGWFHAAVGLQIASRGLPPEDPAFAGLPLFYFWGCHLWAALWLAIEPRLEPWTPLIALNLAAAFATLLGVVELARRLGATARAQWLAAALATLGYAPLGWGLVALRAVTGEVRGMEEVRRLMTLGVDPALRALSAGTLHASLAFFGDKFLVLTPFAPGLALFVAFLLAFLDLVERPAARQVVALAVIEAAALFVHSVVGLTAALLAGAWGLATLLAARHPAWHPARRALPALALALVAAGLALAPYLVSVAAPAHREPAPGFSPRAIGSWLFAGALLVPAGSLWLAAAARRAGAARELFVLAAALTALALGLKLTENNQSKFFNLLFLLLAPAAALGWLALHDRLRGLARPALATLLALLALPTAALAVWGFWCERGQNEELSHRARAPALEVWEWARRHTAPDAVVVDAEGGSDMLVLGARSALWGGATLERDWGHPAGALELRRRTSRRLASGAPLAPEERDLLERLGREVIVVARAAGSADAAAGASALDRAPERYRPLHRGATLALYRWEGAR